MVGYTVVGRGDVVGRCLELWYECLNLRLWDFVETSVEKGAYKALPSLR